MDYERGCCLRLAVDQRRADEPRVKMVDARGADNDLDCAFVFLIKPAGLHHGGDDPAIIFVFLVICTKLAATLVLPQAHHPPSARGRSRQLRRRRAEAEEQVERRGEGHGASVRLRRRSRCSRRRGRGCTFKPRADDDGNTAKTLGREADVEAASDAGGGLPLDAELRGAEGTICNSAPKHRSHASPRVHCHIGALVRSQ